MILITVKEISGSRSNEICENHVVLAVFEIGHTFSVLYRLLHSVVHKQLKL